MERSVNICEINTITIITTMRKVRFVVLILEVTNILHSLIQKLLNLGLITLKKHLSTDFLSNYPTERFELLKLISVLQNTLCILHD